MNTTVYNKQLLGSVFVICRIATVEIRLITRVESEADNSYRDFDTFVYHNWKKIFKKNLRKFENNENFLLICFVSMPTNTAYRSNLHRCVNMQITESSASKYLSCLQIAWKSRFDVHAIDQSQRIKQMQCITITFIIYTKTLSSYNCFIWKTNWFLNKIVTSSAIVLNRHYLEWIIIQQPLLDATRAR